jgi:hypothetical protein
MTRARALKQVIRERAAKTGERYTTARRHVLKLATSSTSAHELQSTSAHEHSSTSAPARAKARGDISEAKSLEKTGKGLTHWFAVLDRFGGTAKGHTALARHLYDDHGVPGWYCQGITGTYERARGARVSNQRCDGEFEVSVSKVIAAKVTDLVKAFTGKRQRAQWLDRIDPAIAKGLATALDSKASKGFVVRPDGLGRYRYKWDDTTVQLYLLPKPGGKASVVITNAKLAGSDAVEDRRKRWRAVLAALAAHLEA